MRAFLVGLLFVLGACKSAPGRYASGSAAPASDSATYGGVMAEEMPPPPPSAPMEPAPAAMAKDGDMNMRSEIASPTPDPVTTGGQGGGGEQAIEKPTVDAGARHIVYSASMLVAVFNLEDAMAKAEAIPEGHGGYIQSMSLGSVVLRVPSKALRKVMEEVGEYGVVEQRSLQAQDVTAEFVDIDSRLRALEETHKQLIELLSKARTVKEALEVREALDRITAELEVLKGRMRQLENLIGFSTLALTLQERGPHLPTPSSNDPFPWVNDLGVEATEWR